MSEQIHTRPTGTTLDREIAAVEREAEAFGSFDACPEHLLDRLVELYKGRDQALLREEQEGSGTEN